MLEFLVILNGVVNGTVTCGCGEFLNRFADSVEAQHGHGRLEVLLAGLLEERVDRGICSDGFEVLSLEGFGGVDCFWGLLVVPAYSPRFLWNEPLRFLHSFLYSCTYC